MLGRRSAQTVARAALRPANYRAVLTAVRLSPQPLRFARGYLLDSGDYPAQFALRTPLGIVRRTLYTAHDMLTVNEVFCRGDYRPARGCRIVVDIGANIGLSALYFLTRSSKVRVHLYEPDLRNVERLRDNLADFAGRWIVHQQAVWDRDGTVSFGLDWGAGRYGSIGLVGGRGTIDVRCRHINSVLRDILGVEGYVDVLKIDIEGLESDVVAAIDRAVLAEVGSIYFETDSPVNPWPEQFSMTASANICRLTSKTKGTRRGYQSACLSRECLKLAASSGLVMRLGSVGRPNREVIALHL